MTQPLISTGKIPFEQGKYPITPNSMGSFSELPKELLQEIISCMDNNALANFGVVNWTCKEVVERKTEWGERKRFFRMIPFIFNNTNNEGVKQESIIPGFVLHLVQEHTTNTSWNQPQKLVQLLQLYPQAEFRGTHFICNGNDVVVKYSLEHNRNQFEFIIPYTIDPQNHPYVQQDPLTTYYQLDKTEKKLKKLSFGNPPLLDKEVDFDEHSKQIALGGFKGDNLLFWVSGLDLDDNDNPSKNFSNLKSLNKNTLETEISYSFHPYPETPLPFLVTDIFIDKKFCIAISNRSCVIKMNKSTIRIDQEILKPLLEMRINEFFIRHFASGTMEITLTGVKEGRNIKMQYLADPFDPLPKSARKESKSSSSATM